MAALSGQDARLQRLLDQQALLAQVARQIGPATELDAVLKVVLEGMRSVLEFRGGTICLVDEAGVYIAASDPPASPDVEVLRVPVGSGLAGRVVSSRAPVYSPDVSVDDRVDQSIAATGTNRDMRSYLAVPLVCRGEVTGLLQVDSAEPGAFDDGDIRLLEGLATQVAGAIESARLFEAMERLEQARSMFIARVGHELRTPLTIIRGLTQMMVRRPEELGLDPQSLELLERVDAAGARLEALTEELLTVSTLETGLLLVHDPAPVAVIEVLEEVRDEAVDPDLVSVTAPAELIAVIDRRMLRQMLALLVQNALTFAGGAELHAAPTPGGTAVQVIDHGPGIPDDRKSVVFERFSRGSHTGSGWGLGLSVVKQLAEAAGASVTLSDTPGGGATFTLTLPLTA